MVWKEHTSITPIVLRSRLRLRYLPHSGMPLIVPCPYTGRGNSPACSFCRSVKEVDGGFERKMSRSRLLFARRAPLLTSLLAHEPRPGGRPTSSFALSRGVTSRRSTDSHYLRLTGIASYPSSNPSSALQEANTRRVREISGW